MSCPSRLRKIIKEEVSLKNFTTFKIGGPARFYVKPRGISELRYALEFARKNKLKIFILGAGSNLLISDSGVRGLVVHLADAFFAQASVKGVLIEVGAGIKLNKLLFFARENGLSGLEFSAGIPGTLGGALLMNAGAWGGNFGDIVAQVKVMDYNGTIKIIKRAELKFTYRKSNLSSYIILSAKLKLIKGEKARITAKINDYLRSRKLKQESRYPSAGCIFKNPKNNSAGRLIDLCGFKSSFSGGAYVSQGHANFIINKEEAKAVDVLALIKLIREKVKSKFNIILKPEIKVWR